MFNLKQYPTPIAGLALGIVGIVSYWKLVFNNQSYVNSISLLFIIIAIMLITPLILKFIRYPLLLVNDLLHPTVGSVVPTLAMSIMLISSYIVTYIKVIGASLWILAVIIHIIFFTIFLFNRIKDFNLSHIVPSWYVPPIGIVVACLTVPVASFYPLAHIILWFGIIAYFIMLPVVLYRLCLGGTIEDARKPTLAILAAPASLTLAGYLTIVHDYNPLLIVGLFAIAATMTASVYLMLLNLLKLPFSPAFSAFTFPLAISATGTLKFSIWASSNVTFQAETVHLYKFALLEGMLASLVIAYVLVHYIRFLIKLYILQK